MTLLEGPLNDGGLVASLYLSPSSPASQSKVSIGHLLNVVMTAELPSAVPRAVKVVF